MSPKTCGPRWGFRYLTHSQVWPSSAGRLVGERSAVGALPKRRETWKLSLKTKEFLDLLGVNSQEMCVILWKTLKCVAVSLVFCFAMCCNWIPPDLRKL